MFLLTTSINEGGNKAMRRRTRSFRGNDRALVRRFQRLLIQLLRMDARRGIRAATLERVPVLLIDTNQRKINVADFQTRCNDALAARE